MGQYQPNAWGLYDMHGNAAEWTRTTYRLYPDPADPPVVNQGNATAGNQVSDLKVVRGGSWRDRPKRSRSACRLSYPAWQKVYNVGFRIVIERD